MKLFKFFKILVAITVISIVYIHLQMQIFDLAYRGKTKEKQLHRLMDTNGTITSDILTLKSANNLGDKFLGDDTSMQFADQTRVVRLETPQPLNTGSQLASVNSIQESLNFLGNFLSLTPRAEAQPLE